MIGGQDSIRGPPENPEVGVGAPSAPPLTYVPVGNKLYVHTYIPTALRSCDVIKDQCSPKSVLLIASHRKELQHCHGFMCSAHKDASDGLYVDLEVTLKETVHLPNIWFYEIAVL